MTMKKIAFIGTGQVRQAIAHQLARENFCNDIILLGRNKDMAQGIALDIQHAIPLFKSNNIISEDNDYSAIANSDIVVITAGVPRKPGMSRLDLLDSNRVIVEDVTNIIELPLNDDEQKLLHQSADEIKEKIEQLNAL